MRTKRKIVLFIAGFLSISPLFAQTRWGLFFTQEEVNVWRQRTASGPYRQKGDVKSNSPGDWDRILNNANSFVASPSAWRWRGSTAGGCVQRFSIEPRTEGTKLRDAAFAFRLTDNYRYRDAVRNELLAQAADPLTDFGNASRWCAAPNGLADANPGFAITEWLKRLLVGYDFIRSTLTPGERQTLDAWFLKAGLYFQNSMDNNYAFNRRFVDRNNGNYTLTQYSTASEKVNPTYATYYGGYSVGFLAQAYNNRWAAIASFVGLVGQSQAHAGLKKSAKMWYQEWMRYAIYPSGDVADMHRSTGPGVDGGPSNNEKGLNYGYSTVGAMALLADAFARAGDPSLYDYTTSEGAYGTEGTPKNLKKVILNLLDYLNQSKYKYATTNAGNVGRNEYLINGVDPSVSGANEIVADAWFARANLYYRDSKISNAYERKGSGTRGYPEWPRSAGPHQPWSGHADTSPGELLMCGQLEGKVWPFGGSNDDDDQKADNLQKGTINWEYWKNVAGMGVSAVPVNTRPDEVRVQTSFEAPTDVAENYAARMRGYVFPPVSGNYVFWIASDDQSELWLSRDSNPGNRAKIAVCEGYTAPRQWDKYGFQRSAPVYLTGGQKYYIEALHKEGPVYDNLAVGWQLPDGQQERPIPGNRLAPFADNASTRTESLAEDSTVVEEPTEGASVLVFPNPADDQLTVEWTDIPDGPVKVSVLDRYNTVHYQREYAAGDGSSQEIDLAPLQLEPGIYYLKIESEHLNKVVRIAKQ
ncbi:MAG: hypothetical protein H7Z75_22945 [Ferruginibacter sp.]|nr:hypothetical protein [Cytophagales bacterium]